MQVIGIDKNPRLVAYARQQAQASQIHNVTFQVQDINKLDEQILQPGSFDLVNMAFSSESLLEVTYPELLEKVATFCSPGGLLRWTEAAMPTTNSFAFEDFAMDIGRALREREYSFYTDPKTKQVEKMGECLMHFAFQRFTGITHCLAPWLRAMGYHNRTPLATIPGTLDAAYCDTQHGRKPSSFWHGSISSSVRYIP